jgi:hypothetical protein
MEVDKSVNSGVVEKSSKVEKVKLNMKFIAILNQIVMLKNMFNNNKYKDSQVEYGNKIMKLEAESIQHDFALLKLETPITRPNYFKLTTSLVGKP